MPSFETIQSLRTNKHVDGTPLTKSEREDVVRPFLPSPRTTHTRPSGYDPSSKIVNHQGRTSSGALRWHKPRLRPFLALLAFKLTFLVTHILFSLYIDSRQTYNAVLDQVLNVLYYHHRTPELIKQDVKNLKRMPKHLSVIVDLHINGGDESIEESLSKLLSNVADISTWCTCAGIPMLSVYERSGILKAHIPALHRSVIGAFRAYFPPETQPTLSIRAPHHGSYSPPSPSQLATKTGKTGPSINLLLLSASDGRETLVDLTKTLTEMSQRGKLQASDISVDLINAEVTENSCGEPDLLVLMAPSAYHCNAESKPHRYSSGPSADLSEKDLLQRDLHLGAGGDVCLRGYPPWQIRLTEIFHVQDSHGVNYQLFRRALYNYAKAEKRFGR